MYITTIADSYVQINYSLSLSLFVIIVPKAVGRGYYGPKDDTRAFKLNRARSLCVIIIILMNITRIHNANGMQYLKKSDYIKNKQLSLSLRYIFVKMLVNGREIIMQ